jgi:hypothetical protein
MCETWSVADRDEREMTEKGVKKCLEWRATKRILEKTEKSGELRSFHSLSDVNKILK